MPMHVNTTFSQTIFDCQNGFVGADAVAGAPLALELRLTLAQLKHGLGTPIQVRKSVLSAYAQTDAAQGS